MKAFLCDHAYLILSVEIGLMIGFVVGMIGTVLYIRFKRRSSRTRKSTSI